jgi:hypothetical protein
MTKLTDRKTRLQFTTEATVRYRGKLRPVVIEAEDNGYWGKVRLGGTRMRYAFSWEGLFKYAAQNHVDRERAARKAAKAAKQALTKPKR